MDATFWMFSATFFEWVGTGAGILGAAMISSKTRLSPFGWIAFILSSSNLAVYAWMSGAFGLLTLEVVFLMTNLVGLWRWLLSPYIEKIKSQQNKA